MTLDEFLVSVGYDFDKPSTVEFKKAIDNTGSLVKEVGRIFEGMYHAIGAQVASMYEEWDRLNYAAKRAGSTGEELRIEIYKLQQSGLSANKSPTQALGKAMRLNPAITSFLSALGVKDMSSPGAMASEFVRVLKTRSDVEKQAYASVIGVDWDTINQLAINYDVGRKAEAQFRVAASAMRVNVQHAMDNATDMMRAWRRLKLSFSLVAQKVTQSGNEEMTSLFVYLKNWIHDNREYIVRLVSGLIREVKAFVSLLGDAVVWAARQADEKLGVAEASDELAKSEDRLSSVAFGLVAGVLMSPFGKLKALVTGLTAYVGHRIWKQEDTSDKFVLRQVNKLRAAFGMEPLEVAPSGTGGAGEGEGGSSGSVQPFGGGSADTGGNGSSSLPSPDDKRGIVREGDPLDRSSFNKELEDQSVKALLFAMTEAEVGNQGAEAQQSFMETIFNRAHARGRTLRSTMLDRGYFPSITHRNAAKYLSNRSLGQKYEGMYGKVVGGSNISDYATGNASGSVGFGRGGQHTRTYRGEKFGVEEADRMWAARARAAAAERRKSSMSAPPPSYGATSGERKEDSEGLKIIVHHDSKVYVDGDDHPDQTAKKVGEVLDAQDADTMKSAKNGAE